MPNYNIQSRIGKLLELEGRGVIKPEHQAELDSYRSAGQVKTPGGAPAGARAETEAQDRTAMLAASSKAAAERDALRTYMGASKAVDDMGTGPVWSRYLDAITPDEDGGLWDTIGATLGALPRKLVGPKTWNARDHLKTVNANVALAGSNQMKGSSSDKDTALMRLSGIGPAKQAPENHRIINKAIYDSGLEQARALIMSHWIGKYGSLANPSSNGTTYEQALQNTERKYAERQAARKLPKAPPSRRGGRGVTTIDLDGNPLR